MTDIRFYKRDMDPFGRTWEEWVELWWKWCYSAPHDPNPVSDTTGKLCSKNQIFKDTWFLAGTFGGNATRVCRIPSCRSIFFPIINDLISFDEYPQLKTESDLHLYAKNDLDTTRLLYLNIDSKEFPGLLGNRVHSNLFDIEILSCNSCDGKIKTQAVSDGYWIYIENLPKGNHTLTFTGEKEAFDRIGTDISNLEKPMFTVSVLYHLIIF